MSDQTDKCANPACHCPALAGSQFCGEQCEQAGEDPDSGHCRCGHAQCQQEPIV
jgi:hypothetical protein